jgi:hypothetical protein
MNRRRVFGVGGLLVLVLLTGCSAAGSLDMEPATDDRIAEQASRTVPETADEPIDIGRAVRSAIENGSATARSQAERLEPGLPFRSDGRYYNVTSSVVNRQPGTFYRLGIDYNGTAPATATVAYSDLSARDRAILDTVLPPKGVKNRPGSDWHLDATYTTSEHNQSVLFSEGVDAVRYEGEVYPITVSERNPTTVLTRQYTATVVTTSTAAYAQQLRSNYVFPLGDLSDAERSVVTEAISDSYYADSDSDDAFARVLERFVRQTAIQQNEYRGTWLVRYDGTVYLAELSYQNFDIE